MVPSVRFPRPIREIRVWRRDRAACQAACRTITAHTGVEAAPADDAESAVAGAHIVCTVTASRTPVLRGEWLNPGTHVNAVGACGPIARELELSVLRRSRVYTQEPEVRSELACGDFLLKLDIQKAFYQGRELALSSKEFSILCKLMERPGETVPKEQLYREVWNTDTFDQTKLLVYIKRIRDKIEEDSSEPKHLLTEWGRGYRFVP